MPHFTNTVTHCTSEYGALAGGWAGGGAAPRRGDSEKRDTGRRDEEERHLCPGRRLGGAFRSAIGAVAPVEVPRFGEGISNTNL